MDSNGNNEVVGVRGGWKEEISHSANMNAKVTLVQRNTVRVFEPVRRCVELGGSACTIVTICQMEATDKYPGQSVRSVLWQQTASAL